MLQLVYNNLRVFRELGLVKELTYGRRILVGLILLQLNTIMLFVKVVERLLTLIPGLDEVEQLASHVTGFEVSHHRMEIYGICPECNKNREH